jgi:hypothetical protein
MARWVEINTGSPVYRIRGDRMFDINTGHPVYRMREWEQRHLTAE